jgi:Domain of unknown function (DUF5679)
MAAGRVGVAVNAGLVVTALVTAVLTMLVGEVFGAAGWLSTKVVRRAVRRLPPGARAVRQDEWLAELKSMEGLKLTKLLWALGCFRGARHMGHEPVVHAAPVPSGVTPSLTLEVEVHSVYEGYCVKCKERREFQGEVALSESGRRMAKGMCPVCGTRMNRLLS